MTSENLYYGASDVTTFLSSVWSKPCNQSQWLWGCSLSFEAPSVPERCPERRYKIDRAVTDPNNTPPLPHATLYNTRYISPTVCHTHKKSYPPMPSYAYTYSAFLYPGTDISTRFNAYVIFKSRRICLWLCNWFTQAKRTEWESNFEGNAIIAII